MTKVAEGAAIDDNIFDRAYYDQMNSPIDTGLANKKRLKAFKKESPRLVQESNIPIVQTSN